MRLIMRKWYVINVSSGSERKVEYLINDAARKTGLDSQIEQVLVPTENIKRMRRGTEVESERKFFPGYILVKTDNTDEAWQLILSQYNVLGFLGGKETPIPISAKEAERILKQNEDGLEKPDDGIYFQVGDKVKILEGPFATFVGLVDDVNTNKSRLKIIVSVFGKDTPIDLEFTQVEKVEE